MAAHKRHPQNGARRNSDSSTIPAEHRDPEKQSLPNQSPRHQDAEVQALADKFGKEDPFGDENHSDVKYKTMKWWQASMIMIAETVSLGILSLPSVLATIGFAPGMILIAGLGAVATYTGYTLGQFKLKYPWVHNLADVGEILCDPLGFPAVGRELFGAAQICFLVFVMGSHILTFSIMLNVVSDHGTCSIVFGVVGLIVCFLCTLPRKLGDVSWMAIVSFISIIGSCLITMIGVGVVKPGVDTIAATETATLAKGFLAVTNIIFAFAGHVAFFSFISELRDPTEYPKALFLLQGVDVFMYLLVAAVTYAYAGTDVASPALGSTTTIVKKVAYGIAIPTIIIAGVINGHVAAKYIYVRAFRGSNFMSQRTVKSYGAWVLIVLGLWVVAWIIAEAIPVFNDLLGFISSLFASWFTYGLGGVFWLFINKGQYGKGGRKIVLTVINTIIVGFGFAIMGLGLYASVEGIISDAAKGAQSFSCEDNSKTES